MHILKSLNWLLMVMVVSVHGGELVKDLGVDNFCTDCDCDFKTGTIVCSDKTDAYITVKKVPESLQRLEIRNASQSQITFSPGAVQARKERFQIDIAGAKSLVLKKRSVSLLYPYSKVELTISKVEEVKFESTCVRGKGGQLYVSANSVKEFSVAEKAFDILNSLNLLEIGTLHLSSNSLKPNMPSSTPNLKFKFENISSIPLIPINTFSSSQSIVFSGCMIKEIGENAFSGIQFDQIRFFYCIIDRIHSKAFIQFSLISALSFVYCQITSISQNAIQSAISDFEISYSNIRSLSSNSLDCQVAKVKIEHNVFKTLVAKTFKISSWSDFSLSHNVIQFMDSEALFGIVEPGSGDVNVTFNLSNNVIDYANRNAISLLIPNHTQLFSEGNVFNRQCDCDILQWLGMIVGKSSTLLTGDILKNSSFCSTPDYLQDCFVGQSHIVIQSYMDKICRVDGLNPKQDCRISPFWSLVEDQIQINTNKGILLTILLAAVFFSLIVSICTMLRWIVYMIQMRTRVKTVDEWNFTKIEEKQVFPHSPDTDHYEKLPLTEQEHIPAVKEDDNSLLQQEIANTDKDCSNSANKQEPTEAAAPAKRKSATFYDEMIDLLKEKLEDPNNYASVADTRASLDQHLVNLELYVNPFDKKDTNQSSTTET